MSIANEILRLKRSKTAIQAVIRAKGVEVDDELRISDYPAKINEISGADYDQGYEDGKNSVVDYLQYAKTVQFNSLNDFGKAEVELNLDSCVNFTNFCYITTAENINNIVEHLTINCDNPTLLNSMLNCGYQYRDQKLKQVTLKMNTVNVTNFSNAFNCNIALEIIDGESLNLSNAINITNMFNYNNALKEVRFVANSIPISIQFNACSKLSDLSIQSIIDGLADLTGVTAQTLTLHATVGAKLTDEQKATITAKNWTLVY